MILQATHTKSTRTMNRGYGVPSSVVAEFKVWGIGKAYGFNRHLAEAKAHALSITKKRRLWLGPFARYRYTVSGGFDAVGRFWEATR